ncbi:hypothetical protein [Paenibacillus silvisoli]|uniref:hypothetical protein n=1 Tax=Paenibacillus silvisoli TaxID=3110539 RepID=UPI0028063F39|nr:hypothetical protein [Paenibacillus silvisoli]
MNKEKDFYIFLDALKSAAMNIAAEYFKVMFYGSDQLKFRERVYCYELYHQLRIALSEENLPYLLHGEMDKRTHREYSQVLSLKNSTPDFIIHVPEVMEHNLIVMEVKHVESTMPSILEDIKKLSEFVKAGSYYRGISYIFGELSPDNEDILFENLSEEIVIILHKKVNEIPKIKMK